MFNFEKLEVWHKAIDFADFVSFNVYLHREEPFRSYISHLHNLSEDKPLILTEFGIDSIREGNEFQADTLAWQVKAGFEMGLAGEVIFAWTDEWYRGGFEIDDWDFGITTRDRSSKPALFAVSTAFDEVPFPPTVDWPRKKSSWPSHQAATTSQFARKRSVNSARGAQSPR